LSSPERVLSTRRLRLEPIEGRHLSQMWEAVGASRAELVPWMAWAIDQSIEEQRRFVERAEKGWEENERWGFAIFFEERFAGDIGIDSYDPLIGSADVGYWIRSDLAGRGLMTEAASAVVEFGFSTLGLHRLELHAAPGNRASVRIAEKLGFQHEGLLRDGSRGIHGYHDVCVFGLLEGDPRPRLH